MTRTRARFNPYYKVLNTTDMQLAFKDGRFDVVIDKGTIDSMLVSGEQGKLDAVRHERPLPSIRNRNTLRLRPSVPEAEACLKHPCLSPHAARTERRATCVDSSSAR